MTPSIEKCTPPSKKLFLEEQYKYQKLSLISVFHLKMLENNGIVCSSSLLHLLEKHNTLQLPLSVFFFSVNFFSRILRNSEEKNFLKTIKQLIQFRLLDKCSHLFICIPLKQTLSSGQKPVLSDRNNK